MDSYYDWFKTFHIIAMTAWMAGMFYLPRLYAYHAEVKVGSSEDKKFQLMESRLLRIIMNPAMIVTIILGLLLAYIYGFYSLGVWFHLKMTLVLLLCVLHGYFAYVRKRFSVGENRHKPIYFKVLNESVTILFVLIVICVVIKPFE